MKYECVKEGVFISRPNRFIAIVLINGNKEVCHVKNTGRCKELLIEGARVFVEESKNPNRKTKYDLIGVYKGNVLYNIDSQAPNKVFHEYLLKGGMFNNIKLIKPECKYKSSRFDFYVEYEDKKAFVEVKGVTLEKNGVMLFPDAPTVRGAKHVRELCESVKDGYEAYAVFIIQADAGSYFAPHKKNDPDFAMELKTAIENGVKTAAFNCRVTKDSIEIKNSMECAVTE